MKFKLVEDINRGLEIEPSINPLTENTHLKENNNDGKNRILNKIKDKYKINIDLQDLKKMGAIHHIAGGTENVSIVNSDKLCLLEPNLHNAIHKYCSGLIELERVVRNNTLDKSATLVDIFEKDIIGICTQIEINDNHTLFVQNSILDKLGVKI